MEYFDVGQEGILFEVFFEYFDKYIDEGFERFIDDYFEGIFFIIDIFKIVYCYYVKERLFVICKVFKFVVVYNFIFYIIMIE